VSELEFRAVSDDEELHLANDLMAKTFSNYYPNLHWLETCGIGYPGFRPEHTRIALCKNEMAGALRVTTDTVRIGEARLKMGGIGWLAVSLRHRHKGVARELIAQTLHYLHSQNFHISMLFGIPNFYHRFGFATTLMDYSTVIDVGEAIKADKGHYRRRLGKPGDIHAIQKIHNTQDGQVACSLLRTAAHMTNKWESWKAVQVLTNDRGKVAAYFLPRITEQDIVVDEVGAVDWNAASAVLHACAQLGTRHFLQRIRFIAPPNHAFVRHLFQLRSTHEVQMNMERGGMMTFVSLAETLESMIPEWEYLLSHSACAESRTEVTLVVDRKPCRIRTNRSAIDIAMTHGKNKISLSSEDLIHWVTGYHVPEDRLDAHRIILNPQGREFLATLFPKRDPFVWPLDRF
jgi:predicted acetyltransferase